MLVSSGNSYNGASKGVFFTTLPSLLTFNGDSFICCNKDLKNNNSNIDNLILIYIAPKSLGKRSPTLAITVRSLRAS